jgi:hypothetical protein
MFSPDNAAIMFLLSSIVQIQLHIADSMPCFSAAWFIVSDEVLLKAPSMSRNAARAISLFSITLSMSVTTLCSVVSVDLPIW